MKAVMISIRPEWCEKILSGKKTVEVRKTKPDIKPPFKCYIYCTLSGSNELFRKILNGDVAAWNRGKWGERKGNVIGEFICDEIRDCREVFIEPTCLTVDEFLKYTDGYKRKVWGWHISDLKVYDNPKAFWAFYKDCPGLYNTGMCWDCEKAVGEECDCASNGRLFLTRPPQSWCYVEEQR